ncbi:MAG: hypothetical protein LBI10_13070 [Deltaproteobacteria bacterium]|nr:hypothetical protein [Deltaproteobacteria bacterium]
MQASKGQRFSGFLSSDNQGSRFTGRFRFMAGVDVNSPFNLGDKLSIFGLTTETQELNSASISYALPLGYSGLRLNLGFSEVFYRLGQFKPLNFYRWR